MTEQQRAEFDAIIERVLAAAYTVTGQITAYSTQEVRACMSAAVDAALAKKEATAKIAPEPTRCPNGCRCVLGAQLPVGLMFDDEGGVWLCGSCGYSAKPGERS